MNASVRAASTSWGRRVGWATMTILAILVVLLSSRYFTFDPEDFFPEQKLVYIANIGPLMLHVTGGVVALFLGPWQFVRRLRARRRAVHRFIGRVYLVSVLATGIGGLLLAPKAYTGWAAGTAFGVLAVLLLGTSIAAYVTIRRRLVARHRAWMIRSYALIFTAVTFRLWLVAVPATGLSEEATYWSGAWVSWMINLLVAELLIGQTQKRAVASPSASGL